MLPTAVRGPRRRGDGRGPRRGRSLPPLLLLATLAACEGDQLTATALLEVTPAQLDFGAVTYGEARTLELVLDNPSTAAALRIDAIELEAGSSPAFEIVEVPAEVPPGAAVTVPVRYTPDDADADAGTVLIRTNAADRPIRRVPVRSGQTFPRLALRPDRIDLGGILSGGEAHGALSLLSVGDAPLTVKRVALRTAGFPGEPCTSDAQCRDARCLASRTGAICAPACDAGCPVGLTCGEVPDGTAACLEGAQTSPALAGRGFEVTHPELPELAPIAPGASLDLAIRYAPGADDRGGAQLVIETDDVDEPVRVVPLLGRPEDLPPVAVVDFAFEPPQQPLSPGQTVQLTAADAYDPEGTALSYVWRFVRRPQGSRAALGQGAVETSFTVDRAGLYVVDLEVLDASGQASTNEARVQVESGTGGGFAVLLDWDDPGTDLDLHVVPPGGSLGALSDCFFENPSPDWDPPGPEGDPTCGPFLDQNERMAASPRAEGAYTIVVTVVAASPQRPTSAHLRLTFGGVEVASYSAQLDTSHEAWDVAAIAWPSGHIADLDTVR